MMINAIKEVNDATTSFFGSKKKIYEFIELICNTSSIALAGSKMDLNPLSLLNVINSDKSLMTAINLAKEYAAEVAEGTLYERAVYGYDDEVYYVQEKKIKRVHKYSDRALIDYLRANDIKYKTKNNGVVAGGSKPEPLKLELINFE